MTTKKRILANHQNSKLSTGPRTSNGKATVSRNALKHWLLATDVLVHSENPEALRELSEGLRREFEPVGVFESVLVDRIAALFWRLCRCPKIEAGILGWKTHEISGDPSLQILVPLEQRSSNEVLGEAFVQDCRDEDALSKLSRHETLIERSLYKTVHELERRQAARQGKEVPLPIAVDVNISGLENREVDGGSTPNDPS